MQYPLKRHRGGGGAVKPKRGLAGKAAVQRILRTQKGRLQVSPLCESMHVLAQDNHMESPRIPEHWSGIMW